MSFFEKNAKTCIILKTDESFFKCLWHKLLTIKKRSYDFFFSFVNKLWLQIWKRSIFKMQSTRFNYSWIHHTMFAVYFFWPPNLYDDARLVKVTFTLSDYQNCFHFEEGLLWILKAVITHQQKKVNDMATTHLRNTLFSSFWLFIVSSFSYQTSSRKTLNRSIWSHE